MVHANFYTALYTVPQGRNHFAQLPKALSFRDFESRNVFFFCILFLQSNISTSCFVMRKHSNRFGHNILSIGSGHRSLSVLQVKSSTKVDVKLEKLKKDWPPTAQAGPASVVWGQLRRNARKRGQQNIQQECSSRK